MVGLPHYKCGEEYLAKRSRDGSGSLLQKSLSPRLAGRMLLVFYGDPSGDVVAADARDGKAPWHFPTNGENKTSPITYTSLAAAAGFMARWRRSPGMWPKDSAP